MARTSSLPEDVIRFKPGKCCRIRNDNGVYRVYKYSAVKLASGEWIAADWRKPYVRAHVTPVSEIPTCKDPRDPLR